MQPGEPADVLSRNLGRPLTPSRPAFITAGAGLIARTTPAGNALIAERARNHPTSSVNTVIQPATS
jgi:hypothetical protein